MMSRRKKDELPIARDIVNNKRNWEKEERRIDRSVYCLSPWHIVVKAEEMNKYLLGWIELKTPKYCGYIIKDNGYAKEKAHRINTCEWKFVTSKWTQR